MSHRSKVVWSEGLFLRPQHFQQQDRYVERYFQLRSAAFRAHGWGFSELRLDRDLLKLGKVAISSARGVFPDGTPFSMPDDDELPAPVEIDETVRDRLIYLCLPVQQPEAQEIDLAGSEDLLARYDCRELEVRDVTSRSAGTSPMQVGSLKTRLLLESDDQSEYVRIPTAHVVEAKVDKQVVLQDAFMPSVCNVSASAVLDSFVNEFLGLLHQRGEALAGRVAATGRGGAAEIADFLLLQVVNRLQPLVNHLAAESQLHPEDFYRVCTMAAGELATFTHPSKRAPELAPYKHDDLRASFDPVIGAIREALSAVLEQTATPIPLKKKKYGISVAQVADRNLIGAANFILAVNADLPAEILRSQFPAQIKIGSVEKIRELVNLSLPGIQITALPVAPRQIPYHSGFAYFQLDRSNELWGQLAQSGGIAVHVAGEFPGLQMELWAIKE
ncbi:MAG: type VI secretion system baseplate subunit TssK [Gammaproteobacteria bacterium]|nr:type VI secretion system baseplate subunit TssK [Gammaproteobacteria bacterium]